MRCLVSITFVQGTEGARAARLPAEQAHVKGLMEQGVVEAGYRSADRSRSWMVLRGESPDHIRQVLTSLPLYPFMELELTPLLDVRPGGWRRMKRIPFVLVSPERGASTTVHVASAAEVAGTSGRFFLRRRERRTKRITYDTAVAARLWSISEQLCPEMT